MSRIVDVIIVKKNIIPDERGSIMHMLKSTDKEFIKFGEVYFSTAYPNVIKGWHLHKKQYQWNYLLKGKLEVYLLDLRKNSKTYKKKIKFIVSDKIPVIYFFPPQIAHGYKTLEKENHIIYGTSGVY